MLLKSTLFAVAGLAAVASASTCEEQRGACETTATANRSYCAALYAQCLAAEGSSYNPDVTSTTCTDEAVSASSVPVSYTASSTPASNSPYASSSTCTETPAPSVPATYTTGSVVPSGCVVTICEAKRSACQSTTTVNESYCASIYESCLSAAGISYNPVSPPTETCSNAPATYTVPPPAVTSAAVGICEAKRAACQSTTTVNESYCASIYYACLSSYSSTMPVTLAPAPTPYPVSPSGVSPASDCEAQRSACQSTSTVNESYCASLYYTCLARGSSTFNLSTGASSYVIASSAVSSYNIATASVSAPPHIATGAAAKPIVGGAVALGALAVALL